MHEGEGQRTKGQLNSIFGLTVIGAFLILVRLNYFCHIETIFIKSVPHLVQR